MRCLYHCASRTARSPRPSTPRPPQSASGSKRIRRRSARACRSRDCSSTGSWCSAIPKNGSRVTNKAHLGGSSSKVFGGEALVISCDVADHAAVERAADLVTKEFGRIDIWVNNAFAGIFSRFMDMSPDSSGVIRAVRSDISSCLG